MSGSPNNSTPGGNPSPDGDPDADPQPDPPPCNADCTWILSAGSAEWIPIYCTDEDGNLDKFVPLTESVSLLGIFVAFVLIFIAVKLILKLIPTIG
jgi:hypothetical protein